MQVGYNKLQFSTNISLYLGNDTRVGHNCYCGTPVETRMRSMEWCHSLTLSA